MAVAVVSRTNAASSGATLVAPTKPTSLAVGDLMVAILVYQGTGDAITLPSGFTQIDLTASTRTVQTSYKIADSGDVAASTFTFSKAGGATNMSCNLLRITGVRNVSTIAANSGQHNSASATCTASTVTPTLAESMIIFFGSAPNSVASSSGYTMATSSPSFSELYDETDSSGFHSFCAYGTRTQITATGDATATNNASAENEGFLVVISPDQSLTTSDTLTTSEVTSALRALLVSVIETITSSDTLTSLISRLWTKLARNIKTWTNQNKD